MRNRLILLIFTDMRLSVLARCQRLGEGDHYRGASPIYNLYVGTFGKEVFPMTH